MNKCKYLLLLSISISFFNCASNAFMRKVENKHPVILRMNRNIEMVTGVQLPFDFHITNYFLFKEEFSQIRYEYNFDRWKNYGIDLYENGEKISNNQLKTVRGRQERNYLVYTRHVTDTTSFFKNKLAPYVQKMLELNQDTLHVGTVAEFKERHPELFKMLTENDTISIRHLKGRNSGLGERVAIPANW